MKNIPILGELLSISFSIVDALLFIAGDALLFSAKLLLPVEVKVK